MQGDLKISLFSPKLGDRAKKQFIRQKQLFQRDLKISLFFKVISNYRYFPRNIGRLEDRAKKQFFKQKSLKLLFFPELFIVYEIKSKNDFLGENKVFQGDFKIS